jgi:hypothetical protein
MFDVTLIICDRQRRGALRFKPAEVIIVHFQFDLLQLLSLSNQASKLRPNASTQPRLKAGARHEQTLEGVGCSALFGAEFGRDRALPSRPLAASMALTRFVACDVPNARPASG